MEKTTFDDEHLENSESFEESIISFQSKLPVSLQKSMNCFIAKYPNWDQYRLIKAAIAGFLVQNGFDSRSITRLYISNMFHHSLLIDDEV